ncbi:MAG: hypothetical protein AMXMBFR7_25700 [Planctomycetota bacterium]
MLLEGAQYVVRFKHPLTKRTVRAVLGERDEGAAAGRNLEWLNRIFMDPALWSAVPDDAGEVVRDAWGQPGAAVSGKGAVRAPGQRRAGNPAREARLLAELEALKLENAQLRAKVQDLTKIAEHWKGAKVRSGPSPTLQDAFREWKEHFRSGSPAHRKNVCNDLALFVKAFRPLALVDDLVGREREIHAWLHDLKVSAGRRQQLRGYILRFLDDSHVKLDRGLLPSAKIIELRAARGGIRWLTKTQAAAVAQHLPEYFADCFRVQVGLGLRPHELLTLRRENFSNDFGRLTLAAFEHLGLKTGPRRSALNVPASVRKVLRRRMQETDFAFPSLERQHADGVKPWKNPLNFDRRFNEALREAFAAAGLKLGFTPDCRIGRRTCGSLLLRAGLSVEQVASYLGNSPNMVREHYAAILPHEVDGTPAALR